MRARWRPIIPRPMTAPRWMWSCSWSLIANAYGRGHAPPSQATAHSSIGQVDPGAAASRASPVRRTAPRTSASATYIASQPRTLSRAATPREQRAVAEPLARPRAELLDGQFGRGQIDLPETVLLAYDAEHFDVDDMRSRLIVVLRETTVGSALPPPSWPRPRTGRTRQRSAPGHGPRCSSSAAITSDVLMSLTVREPSAPATRPSKAGLRACRLASEQLRHRHPGRGGAADESGVHVIVDVADLDRLRHVLKVSCTCICA